MERIKKTSAIGTLVYTLVAFCLGIPVGAVIMFSRTQKLELQSKALQHEVDSLQYVADSLQKASTASVSIGGPHELIHVCGFGHTLSGNGTVRSQCDTVMK